MCTSGVDSMYSMCILYVYYVYSSRCILGQQYVYIMCILGLYDVYIKFIFGI